MSLYVRLQLHSHFMVGINLVILIVWESPWKNRKNIDFQKSFCFYQPGVSWTRVINYFFIRAKRIVIFKLKCTNFLKKPTFFLRSAHWSYDRTQGDPKHNRIEEYAQVCKNLSRTYVYTYTPCSVWRLAYTITLSLLLNGLMSELYITNIINNYYKHL